MAPNPLSSSIEPEKAPMELPQAVIAQAEAAAAETQRDDEEHRPQPDTEASKEKEAKLNSAAANKHMCVSSNCTLEAWILSHSRSS